MKSQCPVFIRLLATHVNNKAVLKIGKVQLQHNHEMSAELNSMLPQNRRLTEMERADVQVLVSGIYISVTVTKPCN